MDALPTLDTIMQTTSQWTYASMQFTGEWVTRILAVDLPVPDVALLFAFALLIYAARTNAGGSAEQTRAEIEAIYNAELLTANRRNQQARSELQSAKKEIERERQKRRREARGEFRGARRATPQVVEMPNVTPPQAARVNA